MVEINLLPWRKYKKAYQNKMIIKILLATVFCTLICFFIVHHFLTSRETRLINRIHLLQIRRQHLLAQLHKQKLPAQVAPKRQEAITTLLSELKQADEVCFTRIVRNNNTTLFMGKAHSAADLTEFLRNWRAASLFSQIRIIQLEQKNHHTLDFRFEAMESIA